MFTTLLLALAATTLALPTINIKRDDNDYVSTVLLHHNIHRWNHSSPSINYHYATASTAQKIAQSCVFAHNTQMDGGGYGQNIAAGVPYQNISAVITDMWYNSEVAAYANQYGKSDPDMADFENFGHFTQTVWKATTHVGCWTEHCPQGIKDSSGNLQVDLHDFTVCNYINAGNVDGEYANNVIEPQGKPTANWDYKQQ